VFVDGVCVVEFKSKQADLHQITKLTVGIVTSHETCSVLFDESASDTLTLVGGTGASVHAYKVYNIHVRAFVYTLLCYIHEAM